VRAKLSNTVALLRENLYARSRERQRSKILTPFLREKGDEHSLLDIDSSYLAGQILTHLDSGLGSMGCQQHVIVICQSNLISKKAKETRFAKGNTTGIR
jgi:hypothetical protein